MRYALFEPDKGTLYKDLFERDRLRLFPNNTFPPNPKDKVALEVLDDICDYLPWYYQYGTLETPLERYQACVKYATPTMEKHAQLYGLTWVTEEDPHAKGKLVHYLMKGNTRVQEIE